MVLSAEDYASRALAANARASMGFTFRDSSLEQPIDAGDVITAITRDIERTVRGSQKSHQLLELAGPESLSRKALVRRAGETPGEFATRAGRLLPSPAAERVRDVTDLYYRTRFAGEPPDVGSHKIGRRLLQDLRQSLRQFSATPPADPTAAG